MLSVAHITLPDGRRLRAVENGTYEYDTNAYIPDGDMRVEDLATGEELPQEAQNEEISYAGRKWHLHEYISEFAEWRTGG